PRMDLYSSKDSDQMTATFELPGLDKNDVYYIDIQNNRLVVSGQSTIEDIDDSDQYVYRERRTGRFSRSLPLPSGTKPDQIKASLNNGVLTVNFPKNSSEDQPQKITIA
ncbi:hypothetical protein M422DRAFT_155555, partial [Sphaerobolus stellatus SS14]